MMNLQDFPNEILTKIFSEIVGDSAFELSKLSRFFYKWMRHIIYQRKITICFGHPDITLQSSELERRVKGNASPDTTYRCELLLRSLNENPDIAPLITEVDLQWEVVPDENNSVELANQLLGALPNLKTLVIQAHKIGMKFQSRFLTVNPMLMLKDVILIDNQLTMKTVNKYLSLPRLENLTIASRLRGTSEDVDDSLKNSPLRILNLGMSHHTPVEMLYAIFKSHSKINIFQGALFGTEKSISQYRNPSGYLESLLSPVQISETLIPLQNSLERLLLHLCNCKWLDRGHDGTRMDLSMMNNLRILQCPSKCFFPPQVDGVAPLRAGLYKLLPPNLEELTLLFEQTQKVFEEPKSIGLESKSSGISRQLLWLAELASNKKEYTPSLKLIVLDDPVNDMICLERRRQDRAAFRLRRPWRAPGAVGEGLATAGITLRAEVDRKSLDRVFGDGA